MKCNIELAAAENGLNNILHFSPQRPPSEAGSGPSNLCDAEIISLFDNRTYALSRLCSDMAASASDSKMAWTRSIQPFRFQFCRIVRRYSDLSIEEVCNRLNSHPRIEKLKELPGAPHFLPITTAFLSDIESGRKFVIEYNPYGGGLLGLGSLGVPTDEIAHAISEICGALPAYRRFEQWSANYFTLAIRRQT